jgi:hypothetical protein
MAKLFTQKIKACLEMYYLISIMLLLGNHALTCLDMQVVRYCL